MGPGDTGGAEGSVGDERGASWGSEGDHREVLEGVLESLGVGGGLE